MRPSVPTPTPDLAEPPTQPQPQPRPRPRAGDRTRWLAARARNAARHSLLIAAVGAVVVIAALLLFVLVPHQVDRALAVQIAAIPTERDTLPLQVAARAARRELSRLETSMAAAAIAIRAGAAGPAAAKRPDSVADARRPLVPDSIVDEVHRQLVRIRQAPLVESYRALADTRLLRDDARVRRLIDSIEQLHAEREAYAALSGPDARYVAMTTRLTQLGQRLTRRAESTYAVAQSSAAATRAGAPSDSASAPSLLVVQQPMADSALVQLRTAAADSLARIERALLNAVGRNADLRSRQDALRARRQLDNPPMAMLLASLVLGLVLGFAFVLWRELRRPTVGDEQELAALTRTRVIVHRAATASVLAARARRRADAQLPPILQPTDEAWPLLHLTLSRIGDVSRSVEVVADQPVLAGAVALNLSAVAAHESRATVLVDTAPRRGALLSLLPPSVITTASTTGFAGSRPTDVSALVNTTAAAVSSRWDAPRSLAIGRDTFIDIVLPRRVRARHSGRELEMGHDAAAMANELRLVAAHHDLAVYVTDHDLDQLVPWDTDVVLCARPGITSLAWLSRTMRQLEARGRRVRAVVLWSADLPLA